jgi:hypothetical protein
MWHGANPQFSARRRRCFGCRAPPFGAALYSRLSAAREARDRSSPSRVTIADAFLPPPSSPPSGRYGEATRHADFKERSP